MHKRTQTDPHTPRYKRANTLSHNAYEVTRANERASPHKRKRERVSGATMTRNSKTFTQTRAHTRAHTHIHTNTNARPEITR